MKILSLFTFLLISSAASHAMQRIQEEYFDSLSKEENAFVGFSCGPLLKARHIPTGNPVAAYFPIGGMGFGYSACISIKNNPQASLDLDGKNSKTVFELIDKAQRETDAVKKKSILAELHKVVTQLDVKKQ